jgi:maleate cis-trans isomerase
MKPYESTLPLGWRGKIGVIIPTENTITEPEFNAMKPVGVTAHFTRMPIHFHPEEDNFKSLMDDLEIRLIELKNCGVTAVAYNCTVGSMACPAELLINKLEDISGVPAVSTTSSILDALKILGVRKIAMATPYSEATNQHEKSYFMSRGIDVVAMAGMNFKDTGFALGQAFGSISPAEIYAHALSVDCAEAEAILISCANFGSSQIIFDLEKKLKKPVITSNIATLWACLRVINFKEPIQGYGHLLSKA